MTSLSAEVLELLRDPATQSLGVWLMAVVFTLQFTQTRRNFNRLFERQDRTDSELATLKGAHATAERLNGCPMIGAAQALETCPLAQHDPDARAPGRSATDRANATLAEIAHQLAASS